MSIKLRVLIKRGEALDVWLAVCLERCIVAQASSREEVIREFQAVLAAEVAYGVRHGDPAHPLDGIEPAPTQYWDAFERASPMDPPEIQTSVTIMRNSMRDRHTDEPLELPIEDWRMAA